MSADVEEDYGVVLSPTERNLFGKYEVGKLLGYGAFAKVYHARDVLTGRSVAIKAVSKQRVLKGGLAAHIEREISILRRLRHPNVIRLFEVLATRTKIYFVLEVARGGELFAKVSKGRFSEDQSRRYFQQLISAIGYCHSRGVFHRDLKPENLLLDDDWNLKVTDFGLSAAKDQIRADGMLHTLCGTPAYVAPEILTKKGYDGAKVDVWSCGVILFVLNAGYLPFNDPNLMVMYRKIYKGEYRVPKWTSPDLKRMLSRLLDTNPKTRISVDEIIYDPWFRKGYKQIELPDDRSELKEREENGKDLNAFDIISFSPSLDLSGLLDRPRIKERFASPESPEKIIEKIEGASKAHNFAVRGKNDWGVMVEGQNGNSTAVVQITRLTAALVVVEITSEAGPGQELWKDTLGPLLRGLSERPEGSVSR